jgi:alpha-glucosidase
MINPQLHDEWYRRAVLYWIVPASWADSDGDGYGDLRGLTSRLDYLSGAGADSLGVGAIWLAPFYATGGMPGNEAIIDHCAVDARLGTMADFDRLVEQAHRRGLKVILDFVAGRTGVNHPWFEQARASRTSSNRDWYIWADPAADGSAPNNWLMRHGGPAWTLDEVTGQYYLHSFASDQPDLNWRSADVRQSMLGVLRFWLHRGVDGFRTEAAASLLKDPALRDDPPNPAYQRGVSPVADRYLRAHSAPRTGLSQVLGPVCELLAAPNSQLLISEAYLNLPSLQELYGACGAHPGLHGPFTFQLTAVKWGAGTHRSFIDEYEAAVGPEGWPSYGLGGPGQPRLASRISEPERVRLLTFLQLTLRGLPVVYYGDEVGVQNSRGARQDAHLAACAPMPWRDEPGAGFTDGQPWLPVAPGLETANVETAEYDSGSLLHLHRYLIHLRQTCEPLGEGSYRSLETNNPEVYVFVRESAGGKVYVMLNFADSAQSVQLRSIGQWIAGTHQLHGDGERHMMGAIELEPYEGRLYEMRRGGH